MTEFVSAAFGFPTNLFGAALAVVVCFWLLVLVGAVAHDCFESDLDADAIGFGGIPVAVSVSVFVGIAWFTSLTGSVLVHRGGAGGGPKAALLTAVLAGALLIAWGAVRVLAHRFRRYFPTEPPPSLQDFVGQVCTVRTGSVSADFGQAEVAAPDGSTAIVQVRQLPGRNGDRSGDLLASGSAGLLYAYDAEGGFFWIAPYDAALAPRPLPRTAG